MEHQDAFRILKMIFTKSDNSKISNIWTTESNKALSFVIKSKLFVSFYLNLENYNMKENLQNKQERNLAVYNQAAVKTTTLSNLKNPRTRVNQLVLLLELETNMVDSEVKTSRNLVITMKISLGHKDVTTHTRKVRQLTPAKLVKQKKKNQILKK